MVCFVLNKQFDSKVNPSANVKAVASMFGLGQRSDRPISIVEKCEIEIKTGQIAYITGGSGAGKSVIFSMLYEQMLGQQHNRNWPFDSVLNLDDVEMPQGRPLVDCFGDMELNDILGLLSTAGLSDAFAILRNVEQLSTGQRYRFRLALALAKNPDVIFIDEFCSQLDRITAAVVSHNIRKFADRYGTSFVVATSHDDMLEDLAADVVVIKHLGNCCDVYYPVDKN